MASIYVNHKNFKSFGFLLCLWHSLKVASWRCLAAMKKIEYRAVIKFLYLKRKNAQEMKDELDSMYGEASSSFATLKKWVMEDRRLTVKLRLLKYHLNGCTRFLHQDLDMRKWSTRWVPRFLTIDQKRIRLNMSRECFSLFQKNPAKFVQQLINFDETWIHHHTPGTKQQSMQWIAVGEPALMKAMVVLCAERWWRKFFGTTVELFLSISLQKIKQWNDSTTLIC